MVGRARTAVKFVTYGLLIGLFFAPRGGEETRTRVMNWATETAKETFGGVLGGGA